MYMNQLVITMEVQGYLFVSELKLKMKKCIYRSLVEKVEDYFKMSKGFVFMEHDCLCKILLYETEAITKIISKNIRKKLVDDPETIAELLKILSRNLNICHESLIQEAVEHLSYNENLKRSEEVQNRKHAAKALDLSLTEKDTKKMIKKFIKLTLQCSLTLSLFLKLQKKKEPYLAILHETIKIFKISEINLEMKTVSNKILKNSIKIFYINDLIELKKFKQNENSLFVILQETFHDLFLFKLEAKQNNKLNDTRTLKKEKKFSKLLLIIVISCIKKNILLNSFAKAKQGIKLLQFLKRQNRNLPENFKKYLNDNSLMREVQKQTELVEEKIFQKYILNSSVFQKFIEKYSQKKFNIVQFYEKKMSNFGDHLSKTHLLKKKKSVFFSHSQSKGEKNIFSMLIEGASETERQSFFNDNINAQISRINSQYKMSKIRREEKRNLTFRYKKLKKTNALRKNEILENLSPKSYQSSVHFYKGILKNKNKENLVFESFESEYPISTYHSLNVSQRKKEEKHKQFVGKKESKIYDELIKEGKEEMEQNVHVFLNILKKNKEKLRIRKLIDKITSIKLKKEDKLKKQTQLKRTINLHLEQIATGQLLLGFRRKKQKGNVSYNSLNDGSDLQEQEVNKQFLIEKNQQKSRQSILHYMRKAEKRKKQLENKGMKEIKGKLKRKKQIVYKSFEPLI